MVNTEPKLTKLNSNIQQLRGIAVISVVLFHLNFNYAKTGFLGVDAFFVISGFLMAMIYGRISDFKTALNFLYKRSVRLLPAYWSTIVITSLATLIICLPHEIIISNRNIFWALGLMPNIGYWRDGGYFSSLNFRPLLHLWSLGVEFQFYLIFPLISKFANSNKKRLIVGIISLALYIFVNNFGVFFSVNPHFTLFDSTAFYMMPTRLWQFMVGIIAFEYSKKIKVKSPVPFRVFLTTIFLSCLLPFEILPRYVYLFTIPFSIICGIALLFSGIDKKESRRVGNFLEKIGKYSFSIYLVHFPIIFFLNYKPFGIKSNQISNFNQIVVLFFLLYLFTRILFLLVEKDYKVKFNLKILSLFAILTLVSSLVIIDGSNFYLSYKYKSDVLKISDAVVDQSEFRCGFVLFSNFNLFQALHPNSKVCPVGEKNYAEKYLLIGDSHANSIKNSFSDYLNKNQISLYLNVENEAISKRQVEGIVKAVDNYGFSKIIFHSLQGRADLVALQNLLIKLKNYDIKYYYILPVPTYDFSVPLEMFYRTRDGGKAIFSSREDYINQNILELSMVSNLHDKFGVNVLNTVDLFCDFSCRYFDEEGVYYFDSTHLTKYGSKLLLPFFIKIKSS